MRHKTYNNGDIIGRYKIIKFIGAGSFGETYLVENIQSPGSNYLLKYLNPPNPASLEQARNKFALEAQVLNDLNHPQIPTLYDKFQENQKDYLVEEYIKGDNLEEIAKNHIFIETEVIQILNDVLNILNYLFQKNIIHRDIKPANLIKRESDGKIFLIDYGTVKQVSTLNSTIMAGTAGYMPQEQIAGNPQFVSDIYALGMTAIQLLTGENPINLSSSENEVICQNLAQFNPHLARILTKMVRRIPLARYSIANDVIADLEPLTFLNQTLIQRYKVINYLGGSGGFSHTYLAEDTLRKQRPCIVKQFNLNNNLHIAHEVEARLELALPLLENFPNHEQISRFIDYVRDNKKLYLIYQFIEGENLKDKITKGNCWSEKEVTDFLQDVLQVLNFIHDQGIIHGDIKPSNLIQRQQDQKFVLIDFSEFKQIFTLKFNHTDNTIVVNPGGTNGYMPYEQEKNQPQHSSDIYALGMTAIQALTGVHPQNLPRDSNQEVIWQNGIQISPELAKILTKMVRSRYGERYQSAQEVLDALNPSQTPPNPIKITWECLKNHKRLVFIGLSSLGILTFVSCQINSPKARADKLLAICKAETDNKQYLQAIETCNQSIQIHPLPAAYVFKGIALQSLARNEDAIASYGEAIKIDPNYIYAWANKGYIHNNNKEFDKGLSSCEPATLIDPNNFKGWLCLGIAQQGLKQYDESINSFDKTINLACGANSPDAAYDCTFGWNNKGESLMSKSLLLKSTPPDKVQAVQLLEEAIQSFDEAINKGQENKANTAIFSRNKETAKKLLSERR